MDDIWFKRNAQGEEAEKQGRFDTAIGLYEANVAEDATTIFSYERLAILYHNRQRYSDEARVLRKGVALLRHKERKGKLDGHLEKQLEELRLRLRKAEQLARKPVRPTSHAEKKSGGCLGVVLALALVTGLLLLA